MDLVLTITQRLILFSEHLFADGLKKGEALSKEGMCRHGIKTKYVCCGVGSSLNGCRQDLVYQEPYNTHLNSRIQDQQFSFLYALS